MSRRIEARISDLPELVISHIMSLMPTKDAVRTSVLSRDFRYKWTSVRNIEIVDKVDYKQDNTSFINFVDRVLLLSRDIRSFHLRLRREDYDFSQITSWICDVLARKIESLILVSKFGYGENLLLSSLLHNTLLSNLELSLPCTFSVPASISFSNLKNLILYEVIVNESPNSDTLTLTFPRLETLTLDNCQLLNATMVTVHAHELTAFDRTLDIIPRNDYWIEIVSKRLVEFKFTGSVPEKFILTGQKVVCATLRYRYKFSSFPEVRTEMGIRAQALLNVFSNLKELEISGYLTWVIANSTVEVSVPVLHHLERLVVHSCITYAKGLLEFLNEAPFLKYLKIDTSYVASYDYNAVEHVPICVKDHLAEIEWNVDNDGTHQLDLFKFLVENGRALKKVRVTCYNSWTRAKKDKILEKLSEFSSSSDVTIVVR